MTPEERKATMESICGCSVPVYNTGVTQIPLVFNEFSCEIPLRQKEPVRDFINEFYLKKGVCSILYKTTEEWNENPNLIALKNYLYIYLDRSSYVDEEGITRYIPGMKIGDGKSYLINLPFVDSTVEQELKNHIADSTSHIQPGEREFWNNKLNYINPSDEVLVLTRD